jgi:hypothetical protein
VKNRTKIFALIATASVALSLAGCSISDTATNKEADLTNNQLNTYEASQPIPKSVWSQYRQTIIDTEQAEIHGVATTTFFYNLGSNTPVKSCPSIGFPVASTAQLTNPDQISYSGSGSGAGYGVIAQQEPNGVYTGNSSGTYVVCVGTDGLKRIDYWEGFVETEGGAAHFDAKSLQLVDDGGSTVITTTK